MAPTGRQEGLRAHFGQPASDNRRKLVERGGQMMVPYLVDPNTGQAMYESADIQRHLLETYGT